MIIKKIEVNNFRNIKEAELVFTDGCNVFYGKNAQGKTNMLEAISVCLGNSFRRAKAASFIPFIENNEQNTRILLEFSTDRIKNKSNTVVFETDKKGKVSVNYNGINLSSAYELYGELKYVVFTPDDLNLIKNGPELRRYYIDNIALIQSKTHIKAMREYKRALNQRNALNIEIIKNPNIAVSADVWNNILAKQGINLTYGRVKYFFILKNYAVKLYSELAGDSEKPDIIYKSMVFGDISKSDDIDFDNKDVLYNMYMNVLNKQNAIGPDGKTRVGAHRDDILFDINEHSVREFGSQGQMRSIALVLKLAEAETIRNYNNERPVILLDEVLSELDNSRREFVIKHFDNSQVFITSCNTNDFKISDNIKLWEVRGGVFNEV